MRTSQPIGGFADMIARSAFKTGFPPRGRGRRPESRRALAWAIAMLLVGDRAGGAEGAGAGGSPVAVLKRLSVEELANLEITSVEKRSQSLARAAAAAHVLTAEDVQRAGATTLAESLRYVPGMQVGQIDARNWAVGARGFADMYANKLLVLVDGRSVYTPLFSGVYWQYQDLILDDLDRIEVIRGPGATVWGANAVNGVINVMSKSSAKTQGTLVSGGGGDPETAMGAARYGGTIHEGLTYRVYGKYSARENSRLADGSDAHDRWSIGQVGFRLDWDPAFEQSLVVQSDAYVSDADQAFGQATLDPPGYRRLLEDDVDAAGANVLGRWTRRFSETSELQLQAYVDVTRQEASFFRLDMEVVDLEMQHRLALGEWNDVVWGAGYRVTQDRLVGGFPLALVPESRTSDVVSAFVQDEIALVPDRLSLTLGTKVEYNDYSGFEVQPGARLAWSPAEKHTVWGSVSRAVRTPSRAEHDLLGHLTTLPNPDPLLPPVVTTVKGDQDFGSESLIAYELGYRVRPSPRMSVDLALFYNDYTDLRSVERGPVNPGTLPEYLSAEIVPGNHLEGESYGAELGLNLQLADWWRLRSGYSYLHMQLQTRDGAVDLTEAEVEEGSPSDQVFVISQFELSPKVSVDVAWRWVADLPGVGIPAYSATDVRVAWRPRPGWEISVVGKNLFDDRHPEYIGSRYNGSVGTEVPRGFFGKVTWSY